MNNHELEKRLINFAVMTIRLSQDLPKNGITKHLSNQLIRSCTAPALNYGEAQAAESIKDFIHKMKIALKELRETFVCLKIIEQIDREKSLNKIQVVLKENDELISIFVSSVKTAVRNRGD